MTATKVSSTSSTSRTTPNSADSAGSADTGTADAVRQLAEAGTSAIHELTTSVKKLIDEQPAAGLVADRLVAVATQAITDLVSSFLDRLAATAPALQALEGGIVSPAVETRPALTAEDVVRHVKRRTVVEDKGTSRELVTPLRPDEVLSWHDHGTHLVVVTTDGKKFSSAAAE